MIERLNPEQIRTAHRSMAGWRLEDSPQAFVKDWTFARFHGAWGFLTQVALLAERHNHHPDIELSGPRVTLRLSTHACKGLSARDVTLAAAIDQLL